MTIGGIRRGLKTQLLSAVQNGEIGKVELLMREGGNIHSLKDDIGGTLLHTAAYSGQNEMMNFLIERGIKINARDEYGHTALHLAALRPNTATPLPTLSLDSYPFLETIEILIKNGMKLNILDDEKQRFDEHLKVYKEAPTLTAKAVDALKAISQLDNKFSSDKVAPQQLLSDYLQLPAVEQNLWVMNKTKQLESNDHAANITEQLRNMTNNLSQTSANNAGINYLIKTLEGAASAIVPALLMPSALEAYTLSPDTTEIIGVGMEE